MANYARGVNPALLKWARETAGLSPEQVAKSLHKDIAEITRWESGLALPTYSQLEKLAYTLYKRPLAVFYFSQPPEEPEPSQSFRTLPDSEIENLLPDTLLAIRQARAMQITLAELNDGENPSSRQILRDLHVDVHDDVAAAARRAREYLSVPLETQLHWRSDDEALKFWRDAVQDVGIFVFKRAFRQGDVSGFCLPDDKFPVIYINNHTSKTRQIFTLFHELAHLLSSTGGITKRDDRYINALGGDNRAIEVFCNRFTGEFLVPSADFDLRLSTTEPVERLVEKLARSYKVSREVVLRKLLDRRIVDQAYYEAKATEWMADYDKQRQRKRGRGDYYATQATYLGQRFLTIAFSRYYTGKCTFEELAHYLNVKAGSVARLEAYALSAAVVP